MIIDMHCHIIPGIDDGAKNEKVMEQMLCIADAEGIDAIIATPHFTLGGDEKRVEKIRSAFDRARSVWKRFGPEKELYLGSEILWEDGVIDALESGKALAMGGTNYVLVEFLPDAGYGYIEDAMRKLQYAGYIPVIAHAERCRQLQSRRALQGLADMGVLVQVNAQTILGALGWRKKRRMIRYLKDGLIHFVGTDAHNTQERSPRMKQCAQYLQKKLGEDGARQILEKNPKKMIK